MSGPFIFIASNRLKTGRLEAEKKRVPGLVEFIQANEPRLIAFNEYSNEDGTEVGVVQVHPDTDSMELHMEIVRVRAEHAYAETLDATAGIQVYGTPTQAILDTLRRHSASDRMAPLRPLKGQRGVALGTGHPSGPSCKLARSRICKDSAEHSPVGPAGPRSSRFAPATM
ncbi:MAG TPA: hypothetical protein VIX84_23560 [Acidimicrobiales bacterium]